LEGRAKTGLIRGAMVAVAFACAALLVPSLASAGWTAPTTVSGSGSSTSQTRVAFGSDGASWVVWKRNVTGFDVIQGTRVTIDGAQGPIVTFSPTNMDSSDPEVVARADGSAVVGWINDSGSSDFVQTVSIAADGTTIGPIEDRSSTLPVGNDVQDFDIALGDDGTAGITWSRTSGTGTYVQAVKVAADGSSGTVHDIVDSTELPGVPAIGGVAPAIAGGAFGYRVVWPQGSGSSSNVGLRNINPDDTLTDPILVYNELMDTDGDQVPDAPANECLYPFDVSVTLAGDGASNAFWICYRKEFDRHSGQNYYNWTVQWIRLEKTQTPFPGFGSTDASPAAIGVPYKIIGLTATQPVGGQPALAWIHELNGGGQQVETWRVAVYKNSPSLPAVPVGVPWTTTSTSAATVSSPAIAAQGRMGIAGGVEEGLLPGQSTVSFTRFSSSSYDPQVPSGSFVNSTDPGFVIVPSGKTLAAFTAIDGSSVGSVQVMTFSDPAMQVDPDTSNYGKSNIGEPRNGFITIRSTGQSSNKVTGISLTGANADRFALDGDDECLIEMPPYSTCRFKVVFTPGTTSTETAKVTVTSESGSEDVNLSGFGLNRTRNRISVNKHNFAARKGKVVRVRITASNRGGVSSNNTRICVNLRKRALKLAGNRCRSLGALPAGASRTLNYRIRVTWRASRGTKLPVSFRMSANNAVLRQVVANISRKGR